MSAHRATKYTFVSRQLQQLHEKRFDPWADQLVAIFATADASNRSKNACGNRVNSKRNSLGNVAPNSALWPGTSTSTFRARYGAAKRDR
jgi:hypothetical protein